MEYRQLGKTKLNISRVGFGGIPIQRIDIPKTKLLMQEMLKKGVNYIDTARGYTVSEGYLGEALEGIRQHFILATKSMSRDKAGMEQDIETSLSNLKTNFIELYQIHNPKLEELETVLAPNGAIEALREAKQAGKIGHIGLTAHSLAVFEKALELDEIETIMFPYNIVENQGEELIQRCKEKQVGFICMKPLAGGAIEDASLAMRYILQNDAVTVVIPGMAELSELEQNVKAAEDRSPLNETELSAIQQIRSDLGQNFCRRCNYCAPCTVGINIPSVFLFEGYLQRYGLQEWAKERYATLSVKASACVECGACETRCPYELPIRKMLKQAAKDFEGEC